MSRAERTLQFTPDQRAFLRCLWRWSAWRSGRERLCALRRMRHEITRAAVRREEQRP